MHRASVFFSFFRGRVVSKEFMRKYIHVAKVISPVLTQEAADHIAEEYTRLRNQEQLGSDIARVRKAKRTRSISFLLVSLMLILISHKIFQFNF